MPRKTFSQRSRFLTALSFLPLQSKSHELFIFHIFGRFGRSLFCVKDVVNLCTESPKGMPRPADAATIEDHGCCIVCVAITQRLARISTNPAIEDKGNPRKQIHLAISLRVLSRKLPARHKHWQQRVARRQPYGFAATMKQTNPVQLVSRDLIMLNLSLFGEVHFLETFDILLKMKSCNSICSF